MRRATAGRAPSEPGPLYAFLRSAAPNPDGTTDITWSFTKLLVDREGNVVERFAPKTTPEELEARVLAHL
jgi:glutathione peroxidase